MAYPDVKNFGIVLYEKLYETYFEGTPTALKRDLDDEELAQKIERLLLKISRQEMCHCVIVIDEVDCFQSNEKAFNTLITQILKGGNKNEKTNASVVGIANSVDLPFRKKNSAIGQRDSMLLFQPYSFDDIQSIVQEK